jgi:hypothetical protein
VRKSFQTVSLGTWVNKGKKKGRGCYDPGQEGLPYGNGLGFFVG